MAQRFYRPGLRKQLQEVDPATGSLSVCGPYNCNMCAAASFLDRQTLGGVMTTGNQMRKLSGTFSECTDADPSNNGTNMHDAATALSHFGLTLQIENGATAHDLFTALDLGQGVIVHGDYDQVPYSLKGDHEFMGFHSVFVNEHDATNKQSLVFDSLDDGRIDRPSATHHTPVGPIWWPDAVLTAYATKFPGHIVMATTHIQRVTASVPVANVRAKPTTASAKIFQLRSAGHGQFDRGSVVRGQNIGGDARWYRVWVPALHRVGFMHASVVRLVG